jgi:sugar phosphate permease
MRLTYISHQIGFGLSLRTASPPAGTLTQNQKRTVSTIWITYALFYLGRVNISAVLPAMVISLGVSRAEIGALGTIFFWVYGIGHFVNGEIGSHISPFRMVSLGLLTIAVVNIAFAFQTSLTIMLILWGINGIAQSAGWSPMFRILAERLGKPQVKRVSTIMPFSYVIGTAVTWTFIGIIASDGNWQIAFWLPGLLTLGVWFFWWRSGIDAPKTKSVGFKLSDITTEMRTLWFALVAAAMAGFVFNGTIIWLPTYISDTRLISEHMVGFVAAIMQVIAIAGLIIARYWAARTNLIFPTTAALLGMTAILLFCLTFTSGVIALIIVALALITLNGAFGLVVSSIPLILAPPGRASSITGSINMMSNFFGGMAGFMIGGMVEINGWQPVFGLWGGILLSAALLIWFKRNEETKR